MFPYIVCFFLSTFCLGIAGLFRIDSPNYDVCSFMGMKRKMRKLRHSSFGELHIKTENLKLILWLLFSALGIFIICYFAGARDLTIGTDTSIYPYKAYIYATKSVSLKTYYIQATEEIVSEPLYIVMVYCTTKVFGTFSSVLFVSCLLSVLPVYISLNQLNKSCRKRYIWLAMLMFYLMFFPFSLNLSRQFIAIGISTLSYKYILKKKLWGFVAVIIIAMLFHTSAIVAFPLYFLYWFTEYQGDNGKIIKRRLFRSLVRRYKLLLRMMIITASSVAILFVMKAIGFLSELTGRYSYQIDNLGNKSSMVWRNFAFVLVFLLIWTPVISQIQKNRKLYYYVFIYGISAVMFFSGWVTREAYRVAYFYSIALVFAIIEHVSTFKKGTNRALYMTLYFVIAFVYFYYFFGILDWGHIVPYTSKLLGI